MNVIDDPTVGARMGSALRTGISSGIQALTDWKMSNMLAERETKGLIASGVDPQTASAIARMSPELKSEYYKQQLKMPEKRAFAQLAGQMFGYPTGGQPATTTTTPQVGMQALGNLQQPPYAMQDFAKAIAITQSQQQPKGFAQPAVSPAIQPAIHPAVRTQPEVPVAAQPVVPFGKAPTSMPAVLSGQDFRTLIQAKLQQEALGLKKEAMAQKERSLTETERYHKERIGVQKGAQQIKKEKEHAEYNKKYLEELNNKVRMSDEVEKNLTAMETAINSGTLPSPTEFKALQFFGADIGDFLSDDAQVFIKAGETMKRSLVQEFKGLGKILESEFKSLERSIPSLLNSKEGQLKLIGLLRKQIQTSKKEEEVAYRILDEHGDIQPRDLRHKVYADQEVRAQKKEELRDIKRIVSNQPYGYDEPPEPSTRPLESLVRDRDKNSYLVNNGVKWVPITEYKPADRNRILARYGITVGAKNEVR